jgi:hypothetical protein
MSSCLAVPISGTSKLDRHLVCDRSGLAREGEVGRPVLRIEDVGRRHRDLTGADGAHAIARSVRGGPRRGMVGVGEDGGRGRILSWDVPHDTKVVGAFEIYEQQGHPE